jgi:hypothetical protein
MSKYDPTDHKTKKLRTQLGIEATVQRTSETSEAARKSNAKLREIGHDMNPLPSAELRYRGSAAFHVYTSDIVGQIFVVSQSGETLSELSEPLAQIALRDFNGSVMEHYGKRRPKFRSGF